MPALRCILAVVLLLGLLAFPSAAFAQEGGGDHHGGGHQPSAVTGALAWGLAGFGAAVILAVGVILFTHRPVTGPVSARDFEGLTGFGGYVAKMRLFSRNARLFMIHVVGMDVIYGTWAVIFNLYLLAIGFDVAFIGTRILLFGLAAGLASLPAGMISDRVGRKLSFILGDGVGAAMSLIAISTRNPALLLATAVVEGVFSAFHGVAEPAFMAENSQDYERVHLFSVAGGTRTAAMVIGSALAGLFPLMAGGADPVAKVDLYRAVAYLGIAGWFASLIPALMLTRVAAARPRPQISRSLMDRLFANVRHPRRIWQLTTPEVTLALGAGFVLPLMNVFFRDNLDSAEVEIGATFASGQAFLVVGSFLAPLLVARWGKVRSIAFTRLLSIPFILVIGFSPEVGSAFGSVLTLAGLGVVARITLMNMAGPVQSAFSMEILDPEERGTQVGIQQAIAFALSGLSAYLGARMMDLGDYRTPFFLMAGCYLLATALFWRFFGSKRFAAEWGVPACRF